MAARAVSALRDQMLAWGGPGRAWHARALTRAAQLGWWVLTRQLAARLRAERRPPPAVPTLPVKETPEPGDIILPTSPTPAISILIACHGQPGFTLRCLAAIARHPPANATEVIVIDDASPDGSADLLSRVRGIRLLRNTTNQGYLLSCNRAAEAARGDLLLFLNNDTQALPGAIDALAATFVAYPDAGLVGAMLLYPDGRLQEAGGILWNDGSAWNHGRGDDPTECQYTYPREADYCSGAALMVRRHLFTQLGGFDAHFAPAYCEDSDLALRARAAGWRCLYQPRARVVHWEGASHGTDTTRGLKAHQVINQARLAARWHATLAIDHAPPGADVLRAATRALRRPVVLVIDHHVPEPDRDAGSRTMSDLLAALLAADAHVIFLPWDGQGRGHYGEALRDAGIHLLIPPDLHAWMRAHGPRIDAVLLSRPEIARQALPMLGRCTSARIAYYGHDLHALRLARQARLGLADRRQARAMLRLERRIWRQCDAVLYPSATEARAANRLLPGLRAAVLPPYACTGVAPPRAPPETPSLLFVGNFAHPPNRDAAILLAREIFPRIRRVVPDARLHLVGARPDTAMRALAGNGITLHADASAAELDVFLATSRVALIPLRAGAGVKLKVVEALAAGLPLVTTPTGAQGLPGLAAIADIATSPDALATAAIRLLRDDTLWRQRHHDQRAFAAAHFMPGAQQRAQQRALRAALGLP